MERLNLRKGLIVALIAVMLAALAAAPAAYEAEASTEKAVSEKSWDSVEAVIKKKLGTGYDDIGMCTGYLYWCLKNAYGVDWGDNSTVAGLEDKLIDKGITKVAEGTDGRITAAMKPGDIVIFLQGGYRVHCAILGEGGKLYHARSSTGVSYSPTLSQWMALPDSAKNCNNYRVYRGLTSNIDVSVSITKESAGRVFTEDNSCYSLAGAQYRVTCGDSSITLTTDADGKAAGKLTSVSPEEAGKVTVKEIKASKGYELDKTVYEKDGSGGRISVASKEPPLVRTVDMLLYKCDSETEKAAGEGNEGAYCPQKGGSFAGAVFKVDFYGTEKDAESAGSDKKQPEPIRTWYFETGEKGSIKWDEGFLSEEYEQSELYYDPLDGKSVVLPLGMLTVQEVKAPEGYMVNSNVYTYRITADGEESSGGVYQETVVPQQILRGDLSLVKAEDGSQHRMANIPFQITALEEDGSPTADGESHIIVTDSNGYASTADSFNGHEAKTNVNDEAWDGNAVDDSLLDASAGIWFGDESALNASKGALPYGRYRIDELPCKANEGYTLLKGIEIRVTRDNNVIDLGTLTNKLEDNKPELHTTAADGKTGNKYSLAESKVTIVDDVYYSGLPEGASCQLVGTVMDKSTGEPVLVDGRRVTAEKEFKPEKSEGHIQMEFTFDASSYGGRDVVVFEEVMYEGRLIAEHRDLDDEGQTVNIRAVKTGVSKPDNTKADAVKTGDMSSGVALLALVLMTAAGLAAVAVVCKGKRIKRKGV